MKFDVVAVISPSNVETDFTSGSMLNAFVTDDVIKLFDETVSYRLLFFHAGSTSGVPYNGARDLSSLDKFVQEKLDVDLPQVLIHTSARLSCSVYVLMSVSLCISSSYLYIMESISQNKAVVLVVVVAAAAVI